MTKTPPVIILVEPQGDRNIGSICRVMLNFGFQELRLVNPQVDHLSKDARDMAVKEAKEILKNATIFKDLQGAVADCHYIFGTSRRFGKYRTDWHLPEDLNSLQASIPIEQNMALVFGREDHGLSTAELDLCTSFIAIPTSTAFPSMNLAQAVGICLYELGKVASQGLPQQRQLANNAVLERMVQHMRTTLARCDYLDPQNPDHIIHTYRKIFSRAGLNEREVRVLHGLWHKIDWLTKNQRNQ